MRKLVALAVLVFAVTILASCSKVATVEYSVPLYEVTDGVAEIKTWENVATSSFTELTTKMTTLTDGVYAVTQTVTLNSLEINGDVIIVLSDCNLAVTDTVKVNGHLTVCGDVDTSAKLTVISDSYGFSGDGTLSLCGGRIDVTSKHEAIATKKAEIIYCNATLESSENSVTAKSCEVVMAWSEFGFYGADKYDMMWLYANDSAKLADNTYAEIAHVDDKIHYVDEDGEVVDCRQYRTVKDETELTEGTWLLRGSTKPITTYGNVKFIIAAGADTSIDGGNSPAITVASGTLTIYGENSSASKLKLKSEKTAVKIASNADVTFVSGIAEIEGNEVGIEGNISLEGAYVTVSGIIAVHGAVTSDFGKLTANGFESSVTGGCALGKLMSAKAGNTEDTAVPCELANEVVDVSESRYAELYVPTASSRSYSFNARSMGLSGELSLTYDFMSLTDADFTTFSADTAMMSFIVCIDAHGIAKFSSDGSDDYTVPQMLGISETEEIEIKGDGIDEDDTTTMVVSLMMLDDKTRFVSVSFLGTSSNKEWASNFDVGEASGLYERLTGAHPEWVTKDNHKGFDVAATRAIKALTEYVKSHKLDADDVTTVFGFTGYSRGAAIANIVASKFGTADFSLDGNTKAFAYTYATPRTTTSTDAKSERYSNIYNVVNAYDIVPQLPMETMGFVRYGNDVVFDILSDNSLLERYIDMTGSEYNIYALSELTDELNGVCATKLEYYTVPTSVESEVKTAAFTLDGATEARDSLIAELKEACGDNYTDYASVSEIEYNDKNGSYYFTFNYSLALVGKLVPRIMNAISSGNTVALLSYYTYLGSQRFAPLKEAIMTLVTLNPSGIANMHLPVPYCLYLSSMK